MDKGFELIRNIGLFALGSMSTKLVTFFCLPIFTLCLTESEYAVLDLSQTTATILYPLLSLSICDAVVRFSLKNDSDSSAVLRIGCVFCFVASVFPIVAAPIVETVMGDWVLSVLFITYYIGMLWNNLFSFFARSVDRVALIAVVSIVTSAILLVLSALLIYVYSLGLIGFFVSSIFSFYIGIAIYAYSIRKHLVLALKKKVDKKLLRKMLMYSLPLVPNAVFWTIGVNAGKYMLAALSGLAAAGLYSAASKLPSILSTLVGIFQQAFNLSAFKEYDEEQHIGSFSYSVFKVYRFLNINFSLILILFSPMLGTFFLQADFFEAWYLTPLLFSASYYSAMGAYYGSILSASMKTKSLFVSVLIGSVLNIAGCYMLVPFFGVLGACFSLLLSNIAVYLSRKFAFQRQCGVSVSLKNQELLGLLVILFGIGRCYITSEWIVWIVFFATASAVAFTTKNEMSPYFKTLKSFGNKESK